MLKTEEASCLLHREGIFIVVNSSSATKVVEILFEC